MTIIRKRPSPQGKKTVKCYQSKRFCHSHINRTSVVKNISFLSLAGQAVMLIQAVVRLQILPRLVRGLTCNGDGIASDLHRSTFKFIEHPYEILIVVLIITITNYPVNTSSRKISKYFLRYLFLISNV